PNTADSPPDRGPSSEERLALRLSDDQLDEVMRLCQPLAPHCRDALLRILAHELRSRRDVGDGELHRLVRTIVKDNRLFRPTAGDPPLWPRPRRGQIRALNRRDVGSQSRNGHPLDTDRVLDFTTI